MTLELAIDLWTFGAPTVLVTWALLRLVTNARLRYGIAIAGFIAIVAIPLLPANGEKVPEGRMRGVATVTKEATTDILPTIWMSIAALLLIRDIAGHVRLARMRRDWSEAPGALKLALAWPERVPLQRGNAGPLTAGLFRPRVVLPSNIEDDFPLAVVRRIALHELAHVRWRDPLVYAILRTIAAVFWPAPVWLPLRWIRREREAAADAFALHGVSGEEQDYVAALLQLSRLSPALAPAMAGSDLEYRARRILTRAPRFPVIAAVVLVAGMMLAASVKPIDLREERLPSPDAPRRPLPQAREGRSEGPGERPQRIKEERLRIARDLTSLPAAPGVHMPAEESPPAPIETVELEDHYDVHVDVHIDDDDHADRDRDRNVHVIRHVIRNRN